MEKERENKNIFFIPQMTTTDKAGRGQIWQLEGQNPTTWVITLSSHSLY